MQLPMLPVNYWHKFTRQATVNAITYCNSKKEVIPRKAAQCMVLQDHQLVTDDSSLPTGYLMTHFVLWTLARI